MKAILLLTVVFLLTTCPGCAISDTLFSFFGDHYTGGGYTRQEKEYDFNQQVEASRSYRSSMP